MAFQGLATVVVEQLTPNLIRISGPGLDLLPGTSGTIGLSAAAGTVPDVRLPATLLIPVATFAGQPISLQAGHRVQVTPDSAGPLTNLQPSVAKTGTTPQDFRITITNTNANLTTQDLEIYVEVVGKLEHGDHVRVHVDADVEVG
jgi:hypothetical protein